MLIYCSIYFMLFGILNIFFIVITSDTRGMKTEYAQRMHTLNMICAEYIAPWYAMIACILLPVIIVWGV